MPVKQLSVFDLQTKLNQNSTLYLLDVREVNEYDYTHIPNSVLIPLRQIPDRLNELNAEDEIVVICHHGMRSQQAAMYLVHSGFKNVANLSGGIDAWACQCDPSIKRY